MFFKDLTLDDVLNEINPLLEEIGNERIECESSDSKKKNFSESKATLKITAKLNSIFRKQLLYTKNKAIEVYSNAGMIHSKFCDVLDLVEYINTTGNIIYIIDKQTICAFLRITIETYQYFLTDATIDEELQNEFQNIESYLISSIQQASENKMRADNAVQRRLMIQGKFGGNDVEYHKRTEHNNILEGEYSILETQRKLTELYNFKQKAIDVKSENND